MRFRRITIICNSYPPEIGAGPTRIYNLAQLLVKNGHEVEVICGLPNYPTGRIFPEYRGKAVDDTLHEGVRVRRIWLFPSNSHNLFHRVFSTLSHAASLWAFNLHRLLFHKPDLVIVSSPPLPLALAGVRMAKLTGCRTLLNVSDLWPLTAIDLGVMKKGTLYRSLLKAECSLLRASDAWMGQSEEILEYIHKAAKQEKPSFLYRNLQESMPGIVGKRTGGVRKVVYAGLLGPVQGIYEIATQMDFKALGLELHLYGEGSQRGALEEFISTNPNRGVHLHHSIPQKEIPAMLRDYHAVLVPLRTHVRGAVPSKLFMAFANGLPVLFSGEGEGAKIVEQHMAGWVSRPLDMESLQTNLQALANMNDTAMDDLSAHCLKLAQRIFSKERQDAAFIAFLENLKA